MSTQSAKKVYEKQITKQSRPILSQIKNIESKKIMTINVFIFVRKERRTDERKEA